MSDGIILFLEMCFVGVCGVLALFFALIIFLGFVGLLGKAWRGQ